jgi:hypothetical protein
MRRLALLAAFSILSLGIVHCVGDDPSAPNATGDQDASASDGSASDASSTNDGSTTDSGASDAGADDDAAPIDSCIGHTDCPNDVEQPSLQVWLRGGVGIDCVGGRVQAWTDQSGKGNSASAGLIYDGGTALAPQCNVATINRRDVLTFTAPPVADAGDYTQFGDETLAVNFSFVSSDYTLFVVHQRTANVDQGILSTDHAYPPGVFSIVCSTSHAHDWLFLGDAPLVPSGFALDFGQDCLGGEGANDSFAPGKTNVDEVVFSSTTGHSTYEDGVRQYLGDGSGDDLLGVSTPVGHGAIGRGVNTFNDDRYHGHIAEVIGYNVALSNSERGQIEAYLKRQWGLSF